jgi:hypothetical protein
MTVISANDGTRGYIVSRKTRKPPTGGVRICRDPVEDDGVQIYLEAKRLEQSLNYKSAAGLAYPTYYEGLFPDLRKKITEAVNAARKKESKDSGQGQDTIGTNVTSLSTVTTQDVILPKLFRRIVTYMGNGAASLASSNILQPIRTRCLS